MRILLFGTTHVDTEEKLRILEMWLAMAQRNPRCDAMLIDSASTMYPHVPLPIKFHDFEDNVGHLSRGGRDGFGRAMCHGLQTAIQEDYDYAVHVEGDSLCTLDIADVVADMELGDACVASIPVSSMPSWPETGFMFFSTEWLQESHFVERYNWERRTKYPEPERVFKNLIGRDMSFMKVFGMRDDFHELTVDNVAERGLSWLTHAPLPVMERFTQ